MKQPQCSLWCPNGMALMLLDETNHIDHEVGHETVRQVLKKELKLW